jgi:hypothetical protein
VKKVIKKQAIKSRTDCRRPKDISTPPMFFGQKYKPNQYTRGFTDDFPSSGSVSASVAPWRIPRHLCLLGLQK